jgi:hypothetical protein
MTRPDAGNPALLERIRTRVEQECWSAAKVGAGVDAGKFVDAVMAVVSPWVENTEPATLYAVLAERIRQQTDRGFTPERDAQQTEGQLAAAALCYLMGDSSYWPWEVPPTFGPRDRIKAGALLLAERDRQAAARRRASMRGWAAPADSSRWFCPQSRDDATEIARWCRGTLDAPPTLGPRNWTLSVSTLLPVSIQAGSKVARAQWGNVIVRHGEGFLVFTLSEFGAWFVAPSSESDLWSGSDGLTYRFGDVWLNGCPEVWNGREFVRSAVSISGLIARGVRFAPAAVGHPA